MTPRYLTRHEAAQYLTGEGFPCASKTLAKLACQGGGPQFIKFGLRVLYRPEDLIGWAVARSRSCANTSDPGAPIEGPCQRSGTAPCSVPAVNDGGEQ